MACVVASIDLWGKIDKFRAIQRFFRCIWSNFHIEFFHNGSKGESVKGGGGKTNNELWKVNTGNIDGGVSRAENLYTGVYTLNRTTDLHSHFPHRWTMHSLL